ncbi:hypothetical protein ACRALDRAFT_2028010 [Sodiomyces alcalophilus JCM 7366]|uniref:uncharacterized protein n=1 Tax=Sodiomyces alcalophilus JCM 7366 TaxID=591952 RepID=UPI0039B51CA2
MDQNRIPPQGGVIEGANPSEYNPADPIVLFIIQASLIIIVCHLLHWPLSKARQPRVIAEVVGGIVLGPSVMGRIPGFRDAIFPEPSLPNLTLVANLGLVLYLFVIGLETDLWFLLSNWRVATSVSVAGLVLPFGVGSGLAWGIYRQFADDEGVVPIDFPIYMLFIGVAMAITAFPVLCRILTELKLLGTTPGIITLSAGIANDVVGWILLALCVALANAGTGLSALWILLSCLGYMLFLFFAVKPSLAWLLRRTGNIENGPSQGMISLILLVALASAFFTAIIGVHAIFGGFMVGLILPRDRSFNIKVIEKLEDLIGALFLPLYFTLSGLRTDIGLLDSAITWGYVFAVTLTAFFTKIIGASVAARLSGLVWRESFTIGALMSCKGLVELIVLNIGLQARILSTRTFTIFVVMALLTTFTTTPLVSFLYPPAYQKKLEAWKRGEIDWDTGAPLQPSNGQGRDDAGENTSHALSADRRIRSMLVYLRLDNIPATLTLISLFGKTTNSESDTLAAENEKDGSGSGSSNSNGPALPPVRAAVRAHGLRLLPLGDRDSSVLTVSQVDDETKNDTVVNIFRLVGQFLRLAVSGEVAVMPESRFAEALLTTSANMSSDLVLIPWTATGNLTDALSPTPAPCPEVTNPAASSPYLQFASTILDSPDQTVAVFVPRASTGTLAAVDRGPSRHAISRAYSISDLHHAIPSIPVTNKSHHIFLPFFGHHVDDILALALTLQLCERPNVFATVVHFSPAHSPTTTATRPRDVEQIISRHSAAARISFEAVTAAKETEAAVTRALVEVRSGSGNDVWHNLFLVGRRVAKQTASASASSSDAVGVEDCLGATAARLIAANVDADVLVVRARVSRG